MSDNTSATVLPPTREEEINDYEAQLIEMQAEIERLISALEKQRYSTEDYRTFHKAHCQTQAENERLRSILEQIAAMSFAPHAPKWPQEVAREALQQTRST